MIIITRPQVGLPGATNICLIHKRSLTQTHCYSKILDTDPT